MHIRAVKAVFMGGICIVFTARSVSHTHTGASTHS